jgi:hypothetical protein
MVRGDTRSFQATVLAPPNFTSPQDLTGWTVSFIGYTQPTDPCEVPVPLITLSTTSGVVVATPANGIAVATLQPSMTQYLAPQTLTFKWVTVDTEGNQSTIQEVDVTLTN